MGHGRGRRKDGVFALFLFPVISIHINQCVSRDLVCQNSSPLANTVYISTVANVL